MADRWTVLDALEWTAKAFRERGIASGRLDAELLLCEATGLERIQLYTLFDRPLTPEERGAFRGLVQRRAAGEPVQYIRGVQEFWSLELEVTPDVLVPRGDTEVLVEEALAWARSEEAPEAPRIVDVGTGSGAIAIALASELPDARILAIDVSADALTVARRNCAKHGLAERIALVQGNLLEPVLRAGRQVDAVVSNPPYIPSATVPKLMREVAGFEPRLALDGGPDGLDLVRPLLAGAERALAPNGLLAVEIGEPDQAHSVGAQLRNVGGWEGVRVRDDYAGQPRVVVARRALAGNRI